MPRLRAVLWDLDGTLTDSVRFVVATANAIIERYGGTALAFDRAGGMSGLPLESIFRLAWPDLQEERAQRLRDEYRALYEANAVPATRLYRGARATLRAFRQAGLLQATVTGKRAADCERILRGLGVSEIDLYLGGDSVRQPKPAPDLARLAAQRLACDAAECVVVGDSASDIAMGREAGMRTIQVLWGFERGRHPDAERAVRNWRELRAAVWRLSERDMVADRGPLRP